MENSPAETMTAASPMMDHCPLVQSVAVSQGSRTVRVVPGAGSASVTTSAADRGHGQHVHVTKNVRRYCSSMMSLNTKSTVVSSTSNTVVGATSAPTVGGVHFNVEVRPSRAISAASPSARPAIVVDETRTWKGTCRLPLEVRRSRSPSRSSDSMTSTTAPGLPNEAPSAATSRVNRDDAGTPSSFKRRSSQSSTGRIRGDPLHRSAAAASTGHYPRRPHSGHPRPPCRSASAPPP